MHLLHAQRAFHTLQRLWTWLSWEKDKNPRLMPFSVQLCLLNLANVLSSSYSLLSFFLQTMTWLWAKACKSFKQHYGPFQILKDIMVCWVRNTCQIRTFPSHPFRDRAVKNPGSLLQLCLTQIWMLLLNCHVQTKIWNRTIKSHRFLGLDHI